MSDNTPLPHLEELLGEKLYTVPDGLKELGWEFTHDVEAQMYRNIKCCGQLVSIGGWVGAEHLHCRKCGKGMQDVLSYLPTGRGAAGLLKTDGYQWDDGRVWMLKNVWGEIDGNEG